MVCNEASDNALSSNNVFFSLSVHGRLFTANDLRGFSFCGADFTCLHLARWQSEWRNVFLSKAMTLYAVFRETVSCWSSTYSRVSKIQSWWLCLCVCPDYSVSWTLTESRLNCLNSTERGLKFTALVRNRLYWHRWQTAYSSRGWFKNLRRSRRLSAVHDIQDTVYRDLVITGRSLI